MSIDSFQKMRYRVGVLWVLSLLLVLALASFPLIRELENQVIDRFFALRGARPPPPELLIVAIDEPSFQELRHSWPWPRSLHARLIDRLSAAGARLILFDVIFAEPTDRENDSALASSIKRAGNVILAQTSDYTNEKLFSRAIRIRPLDLFAKWARATGLTMVRPDGDGVVRHFHVRLMGAPTLPACAVSAAGKLHLPPDYSGLIKFVGPARSIDTLSYYQVLDDEHPVPDARIRGRIVLIGRLVQASPEPLGQTDLFSTPFFHSTGVNTSGVEILANITHNLFTGQWITEIPAGVKLITCLGYLLLFSLLLAALSPLSGLGALGASSLGLLALSYWLFSALDFWAPPVMFVLGSASLYTGNVLLQYLAETRQKRWLRGAFNRYVSPAVVESIVKNPKSLELGGREIQATVFFSDLANFTSLSERIPPQDLIAFLNQYFTPMTDIILEYRGGLDKFIGDAIMAFWGAPIPMENHARYACEAALKMQEAIAGLWETWRLNKLPLLEARMGIHSGPVVAGNVGSRERFNYTVLGDTVNLASRLEGANKFYGTAILISEDTHRLAGPAFLTREIDLIRVKGRQAPVKIYELIGRRGEMEPAFLDVFSEALSAYKNGLWDRAELLFESIAALDPPSKTYLQRCRRYRTEPPPRDWDGVFTQKAK
jgi:adenylate cyclase